MITRCISGDPKPFFFFSLGFDHHCASRCFPCTDYRHCVSGESLDMRKKRGAYPDPLICTLTRCISGDPQPLFFFFGFGPLFCIQNNGHINLLGTVLLEDRLICAIARCISGDPICEYANRSPSLPLCYKVWSGMREGGGPSLENVIRFDH